MKYYLLIPIFHMAYLRNEGCSLFLVGTEILLHFSDTATSSQPQFFPLMAHLETSLLLPSPRCWAQAAASLAVPHPTLCVLCPSVQEILGRFYSCDSTLRVCLLIIIIINIIIKIGENVKLVCEEALMSCCQSKWISWCLCDLLILFHCIFVSRCTWGWANLSP